MEDLRGQRRQPDRAGHHAHAGAAIEANAVDGDEHQRRSYPDAGGAWQGAGYEHVRSMDLAGAAERIASEAVALLTAPQLPPGRRTIVLDPSQLYLQVHESCGHPTELDRVFGTEASYAGTSFLTTDKLDAGLPLRLGDRGHRRRRDGAGPAWARSAGTTRASSPRQCRSCGAGIFVGYLSSRETAPRIGRRSGGAMRADGWNRIPLIRMTNVNLLPKPGMSLDDIIADTDDGLLLASNRSWSIDDRRLNFQFATELAYEIRGGKLGQLYRNATYTGHHARVLGQLRRHRRRVELRDAGDPQLRQGRARAGRATSGTAAPGPASATSRSG